MEKKFALLCLGFVALCFQTVQADDALNENNTSERPNILWLSTEDMGPHLACYGDKTATTPNLDAFAKRSLIFNRAWSNYPVCAPARTTIITGMYAASNGAGNQRSSFELADSIKMFPLLMREAGYFCTNNAKEDYNHPKTGKVWDISSRKAHWRERKKGQPFFAVFNHTGTHESKIRKRPHQAVIDPAIVKLQKYWPDTPEVRTDWAQYYDNIQTMDQWFGKKFKEVSVAGLAEDTIVVFFGDHGSGMPRHKRFAGDSGQRVPFLVYVPEKYKDLAPKEYMPGTKTDEPVSFVDLAPTILSLAGIDVPKQMQGRAFMGARKKPAPDFLFGFRDRMDERRDLSRSARDDRYVFIRNFQIHLPAGQHLDYQMQTPTTRIWKQLFDEGKLDEIQNSFWEARQPEEFYDLQNDPEETKSLDLTPPKERIERLRNAVRENCIAIRDIAFIPEGQLYEISKNQNVREFASDDSRYPIAEIYDLACTANSMEDVLPELKVAMKSSNAITRYWAAYGLLVSDAAETAIPLLKDASPSVRIAAAEIVARKMEGKQRDKALQVLLKAADHTNGNFWVAVEAWNAIDRLDEKANSIKDELKKLSPKAPDNIKRSNNVIQRIKAHIFD